MRASYHASKTGGDYVYGVNNLNKVNGSFRPLVYQVARDNARLKQRFTFIEIPIGEEPNKKNKLFDSLKIFDVEHRKGSDKRIRAYQQKLKENCLIIFLPISEIKIF